MFILLSKISTVKKTDTQNTRENENDVFLLALYINIKPETKNILN